MTKNNTDTFELRSEEVQDILTRVPHWMIRWGTVVIFAIVVMMLTTSWFVKYPDIVTTEIIITTNIPPEKLVAKTAGRIEAILVKDRAIVPENTPLAVIENAADYQDVFLLKKYIANFKQGQKFPFEQLNNAQLGDVESAFALFQKEYIAENLNTDLQPYQVENNAQKSESTQIKERLNLLVQQKGINEQELKLQKSEINRYTTLYNKGVISDQEFETKKLNYLQSEKNYKNLLSSISQLKSSLIENKRAVKGTEISGTKEEVNLDRNTTQSFYQLKKAIKDWELNYVLMASVAGEVSFSQVWVENQTITAGENVFSVVPKTQKGFVGKVKAPAHNSGKIKVGQKVNIRLANFPDREFGMLKGEVKNIALVPDKDGNIMMDIALPKKMITNYKKEIPFQQEMKGSAEIITEDLRLLERILYQFRDVFKTS
jgi:multidrug resistance efflux pump